MFLIQVCLITGDLIMLIKCVSAKNTASGYFEDDFPFLNSWKNRNSVLCVNNQRDAQFL